MCEHRTRKEYDCNINSKYKRVQECILCGKKRIYNPLNKKHIISSDPDLWSDWDE